MPKPTSEAPFETAIESVLLGDRYSGMMREDLKEAERDALCTREGYRMLDRNQ